MEIMKMKVIKDNEKIIMKVIIKVIKDDNESDNNESDDNKSDDNKSDKSDN